MLYAPPAGADMQREPGQPFVVFFEQQQKECAALQEVQDLFLQSCTPPEMEVDAADCAQSDGDGDVVQPNIVFVLLDRLGWADLSGTGDKFATPHLDAAPLCAPDGRTVARAVTDGPLRDEHGRGRLGGVARRRAGDAGAVALWRRRLHNVRRGHLGRR